MKNTDPFRPGRALANALRMGVIACLMVALGGCASGPNRNPRDPLEPMNRKVMEFNDAVDSVVLKPVATVYRRAVPPLVRTGVSNFFGNLSDAWSFVNSALQFKLQNAAEDFMRVNVNTFFGFGGLMDIASELSIERHREDFGQTLGRWGVPAGPFVMLPLLGPSTLRDTLSLSMDRKGDLLYRVKPADAQFELYSLRVIDVRSNLLRAGTMLDEAALDKYSFLRDAYLQRRRTEIFDGEQPDSDGQEPRFDLPAKPGDAPAAPAQGAATTGR